MSEADHLDWKRRIAHVEPVLAAGVARWQGAGAGISQRLAGSARKVLAGADPDGVVLNGLVASTEAELLNYVTGLADPIVVAYASGEIGTTEARSRFDDVIDIEHRLAASVGPCLED